MEVKAVLHERPKDDGLPSITPMSPNPLPMCPACGRGNIVVTKTRGSYCRRCGHQWGQAPKKKE